MKVKCKDNFQIALDGCPFRLSLTIDGIYGVVEEKDEYYLVVNDKGELINYRKDRFEIVEG